MKRTSIETREHWKSTHCTTPRLRELITLAAITEAVFRHSSPKMQGLEVVGEHERTTS